MLYKERDLLNAVLGERGRERERLLLAENNNPVSLMSTSLSPFPILTLENIGQLKQEKMHICWFIRTHALKRRNNKKAKTVQSCKHIAHSAQRFPFLSYFSIFSFSSPVFLLRPAFFPAANQITRIIISQRAQLSV